MLWTWVLVGLVVATLLGSTVFVTVFVQVKRQLSRVQINALAAGDLVAGAVTSVTVEVGATNYGAPVLGVAGSWVLTDTHLWQNGVKGHSFEDREARAVGQPAVDSSDRPYMAVLSRVDQGLQLQRLLPSGLLVEAQAAPTVPLAAGGFIVRPPGVTEPFWAAEDVIQQGATVQVLAAGPVRGLAWREGSLWYLEEDRQDHVTYLRHDGAAAVRVPVGSDQVRHSHLVHYAADGPLTDLRDMFLTLNVTEQVIMGWTQGAAAWEPVVTLSQACSLSLQPDGTVAVGYLNGDLGTLVAVA